MAGKSLNFYNLTGGLNTVQDLYTINSGTNRTESPDMVNIEYYKLGGIKTMLGNQAIAPQFVDSGSVTCGIEYQSGSDVHLVVTTSTGRCYLYDDTTRTFSQFYKFPRTTERHSMCEFASGLVITNGQDQMVYYKLGRTNTLTGTVSGTIEDGNTEAKLTVNKTDDTEDITLALTVGDRVKIGDYYYWVTKVQPEVKENTEGGEPQVTTPASISVLIVDFNSENQITETVPSYPINLTEQKVQYTEISRIASYLTNSDPENPIDPIAILGLAIASYKGRIWVGTNDGKLLYSELGLYNGWDIRYDAGAFENFEEDGSEFTGLHTWSEYLICHKKQYTYILDANSDDSSNWQVKPYSESTCYSQQSMVSCNEGYFIYSDLSTSILPLLSRSIYNTTYQAKEISQKIKDSFMYIDNTKLANIYATYAPKKQYLMFYMPFSNGNGSSNKCFIYDLLTKSWLYRELPQQITCAFSYDNDVYIGTEDGYVLKEFTTSTFNGAPVEFSYTTPSYIWGGGINYVTTSEFRVKLLNETSNHFYIETIRDGSKTSKDKRLISNAKTNGVALVWDIGLNLGDRAITEPIVSNAYHYHAKVNGNYIYEKDEEGQPTEKLKNYYTAVPITPGSLNIDVYSKEDLSQDSYLGKNQNIVEEGPGNNVEYNRIEYTEDNIYAWVEKYMQYHCYQSTVDGNIKAWVDINDTTKALVNVTDVSYTTMYGYQCWEAVNNGNFGSWKPSSLYAKIPVELTTNYGSYPEGTAYTAYVNFQGGDNFQNNWSGFTNIMAQYLPHGLNDSRCWVLTCDYSGTPGQRQYFAVAIIFILSSEKTGQWLIRAPQYDETGTKEGWNQRHDSIGARTKNVSYYSEEHITIDGVRYNRYSAGDYGENLATPKYTRQEKPEVGDTIYTTKEAKEQYSTVVTRATDNSYITCLVDGETKTLYRSEINDSLAQVPTYYMDRQVEFVDEELIQTERSPESFYPELPNPDADPPTPGSDLWYQSLTDTVWDTDLWSGQGYISKRFLLSDQYFETVQFRFYGTTENDSMTLCGFEVDGIQLTEVPH